MKILFAVHHFPPRYTGGAELRTYRTAAALQLRGHQVQVVAVEQTDSRSPDGVKWVEDIYQGVPVRRLSFDQAAAQDPFRWAYDNPWIGAHLCNLLEELNPDLFHLIGGYLISGSALQAATQLHIPRIVTLTDFWFLCPRITMLRSNGEVSEIPIRAERCARCLGEEKRRFRLLGKFAPGLMDLYWSRQGEDIHRLEERSDFLRKVLNDADAIISPSQFLRQAYTASGIDPQRIVFSRQGRDFPGLRAEMLEKTSSPVLRVGYIGQLVSVKGVQVLFQAARLLPGAPLTVQAYGDDSLFPKNVARLRSLADGDSRIHLAGTYRPEELSRVFRELDVIVMPSLWYENSPNVILEAFAHRTPVIASNLGGMAELVCHAENGLLFEPGNPADLARQLQRLLDEPGLLPSLKERIPPVKSEAQEMDELEEIYSRVLG